MISVFCKQCRDDKYYSIKLTFNKSDLLSLLIVSEDNYGFMLRGWNCTWMYVSKEDYDMLKGVMKYNETKQL